MISDRPLVSIVTPTRNQGRYIEQTIRSVARQTYPNIEHIIVDGGSTDETPTILRRLQSELDLVWWSQPDDGMYQALNRGFARATGEIFAYLNSDDLYFPWSVEVAVAGICNGVDLIYGDALLLDDATGDLRPHFQLPYREGFLLTIGSFAQPATWWRRTLYESVGGFDETLRSVGDLDFYLRATKVGRVAHVREFLALMRRHPGMQTVAAAPRLRLENQRVRDRYIADRDRGLGRLAIERAIAWEGRRAAWANFLVAASGVRGVAGPWRHFLAEGVRLAPARVVAGQLPFVGSRWLQGAVRSGRDWRSDYLK